MQLLNSHSTDESGLWETKMLIWDMEQFLALVSILSLPGSLLSHLSAPEVGWWANRCLEKQEEVPKSVLSYKWQTGWDFISILLQGPSPSCQLLLLVLRSLLSLGNSFLLNKMKRFSFLPALTCKAGEISDKRSPTRAGELVTILLGILMVQLKEFSNLQGSNVTHTQ